MPRKGGGVFISKFKHILRNSIFLWEGFMYFFTLSSFKIRPRNDVVTSVTNSM